MARAQRRVPWLDTNKNGTWYVHWYDPGERRTQRISLRTKAVDEAKARFGAFLSEGNDVIRRAPSLRLDVIDAVKSYLSEHADVRCADPVRQHTIAEHLLKFFGDTPIADIDIPLARGYAEWRGAAPATVRRELGMLVAVANHARRWKRLSADDMPQVELPSVPVKEVSVFTPKEIQSLIRSAEPRLRAFITLAYFTAARRKSIEMLETRQIDMDRRVIYLHKSGSLVTSKRRAIVPINDACVLEIRMLMALYETGYLFGNPQPFYRPFKKLCTRMGMPDRSHPHLLRHSRATHLLQDGQSIFKVAGLLGDSVTTVQNRYGHHTPEHAASAVTEFDRWLTESAHEGRVAAE